jgi:hypothetical protein
VKIFLRFAFLLASLLLITSCKIWLPGDNHKMIYSDDDPGAGKIRIVSDSHSVSIENDYQRVCFRKNEKGLFILTTYIHAAGTWKEMFSGAEPIVQGPEFDLYPDSYSILENSPQRKIVDLSGRNKKQGYDFDIRVISELKTQLIHFIISAHLANDLEISGYEPTAMLCTRDSLGEAVTIYQQVPSFQWKGDAYQLRNGSWSGWNSCFPYAYTWAGGVETAVFFDMNKMDWFSFKDGVKRFLDIQIRAVKKEDGTMRMGMEVRNPLKKGTRIAAGDMTVDFFLYGKANAKKPSRLDALGTVIKAFSPCFPAQIAHWPQNHIDPGKTSYAFICSKISQQLMLNGHTYEISPFITHLHKSTGVWRDWPVFPEDSVKDVVRRPDYALNSGYTRHVTRTEIGSGSWFTCNNALVPWIGFERLHPDQQQHDFINASCRAMKVYYDPDAKLVRDFEASAEYRGHGKQFGFQFYTIGMETMRAVYFRDPKDFDPAIPGQYLMSLEGVKQIAVNNQYLMPHLFNAEDKSRAASVDRQDLDLGSPYDVWTIGLYAYDMAMAHQFTHNRMYLEEAEKGVEKLFSGISFSVENKRFKEIYTDPYDFPFNVEESSAWGVAASQYLFRQTKEEKYLRYSRYFRNVTLRFLRWYESNLRDDKADQCLGTAGLFNPMPAGNSPTPWENIMTYLPFLMELRDTQSRPARLMLNMYNQFRVNNMYFSAATWDTASMPAASAFQRNAANYLVAEDFYTPEQGTPSGYYGPCIYMSDNPYYACFMFEAFCRTSDKELMALNLDVTDNAFNMINGVERNFIIYNPSPDVKSATLKMNHLLHADYEVTIQDARRKIKSFLECNDRLQQGMDIVLPPGAYMRIRMVLHDPSMKTHFRLIQDAQRNLSLAYQALQVTGRDEGLSRAMPYKPLYREAFSRYQKGDYKTAAKLAEQVSRKLAASK